MSALPTEKDREKQKKDREKQQKVLTFPVVRTIVQLLMMIIVLRVACEPLLIRV